MAATTPSKSALHGKPDFSLPIPPPLLHTRSGNEIYGDMPHTPTGAAFMSPYSTPQGSPSKSKMPPGANELPDIFDNAMVLESGNPTKGARALLAAGSPNKSTRQGMEDVTDGGINRPYSVVGPGSPARKTGKENTPPSVTQAKPSPNQAAVQRQEPYQARDTDSGARPKQHPQRGLTPADLEKLQLPKVKRLANVTQLCEYSYRMYGQLD